MLSLGMAALAMAGVLAPTQASAAEPCPAGRVCMYTDRYAGGGRMVLTHGDLANRNIPVLSDNYRNRISSIVNYTDWTICYTMEEWYQGNVMRVGAWENWDQLPFWAEDNIESFYKC
jgi:hypothetical protein